MTPPEVKVLGRVKPQGSLLEVRHARRHLVTKGSFYERLAENGDAFLCDDDYAHLYAPTMGRPSIPPTVMLRALLLATHDRTRSTPRPPGVPGWTSTEGGHGRRRRLRRHRSHHLQPDAGSHGGCRRDLRQGEAHGHRRLLPRVRSRSGLRHLRADPGVRAPLHRLIDPFLRKERFGEMPLGHRLTWRRKPKGTTACRESGGCPKTCRALPRKTRVTWRRPDCLNLSSQGCNGSSSDTTSWSGVAGSGRLGIRRLESPSGGRWPMRSLKGMHEAPKSRSTRRSVREGGIAYGARALWQRSLRSSPRAGKPSTWRREAGVSITQRERSA